MRITGRRHLEEAGGIHVHVPALAKAHIGQERGWVAAAQEHLHMLVGDYLDQA